LSESDRKENCALGGVLTEAARHRDHIAQGITESSQIVDPWLLHRAGQRNPAASIPFYVHLDPGFFHKLRELFRNDRARPILVHAANLYRADQGQAHRIRLRNPRVLILQFIDFGD
jgi:hypothetical protein